MLALARRLSPRRFPSDRLLLFFFSSSESLIPRQSPIFLLFSSPFSSASQSSSPPPLADLRGGCNAEDQPPPLLPLCPGCGVHMQSTHSSLPGFFIPPAPKSPDYHAPLSLLPGASDEPHLSLSLKSGVLSPNPKPSTTPGLDSKPLVCSRCHSLRHYGRVKDPSAENLLPDFDFDRMVAPKMASPSGPRSVVLMVVDAADFDGSFPRKVARFVSSSIEKHSIAYKEGKPANVPRVILVVTKIDLLPSSIAPDDLEHWVRKQARIGGANKLSGVHLVSSVRDWGVRNLVEHVRELAGSRGNVWAVGAQNAGKSTLINAMGKCVEGKVSHLTVAPVPGTTLGIVRVEGVLGEQAKLFDTPGILHPYQITSRLTREEQKLVLMSKELKPRTYRIKAGHSVHIGGLMKLDVEELSVETLYLTVWASPLVPLHMGKTENTSTMKENHFGRQLQPPIGENRVAELGKWSRREFRISGSKWDASSVDIATAGLGWIAVGLKGEAVLGVWTYDGIDVITRSPLLSIKARIFEEAGFTTSKIVAEADSVYNKLKHKKSEKGKHLGHKSRPVEGDLNA
ncbi:GTP-binding protein BRASSINAZOLE INSENSITIVE PALE GREEN 2, chloroplastic [Dioscorea cayenensis subsp. rotundata]|uniref:GTP-binding protein BRASSINAZOLE INSENSITIVE PALE GREEN 2, chloroplastic n=1 Tax=Dioscorea cayennensis subsp. rotundata TaxID=55577 RepID=A0AB40B6V0_DIOCR|nr:GTP-binding protein BRASSINAZOLE INSENSITIVE PALE GREEN 2, chloroplastic [Dioscorea cayenensis subsp. rotundata]